MNNTSANNISEEYKSTSSMDFPSKPEGIVWCSVFILAAILIVVGNLLTIVLFVTNQRLRKKSLFLVINMAVADLMLGAVTLPMYIYWDGKDRYQLWSGSMSQLFVYCYTIVDSISMVASLITATFMSCERLYAVYRPFRHRTLSVRAYCIVIIVVWTLASLDTIFLIANLGKYYSLVWLSTSIVSIILICGCNIAIRKKFQESGIVASSLQQSRDSQSKRLTKTLMFVSVLALFCWLPFASVFSLNFLLDLHDVIPWRCFVAISFVNVSNAFVNPVVYAYRVPEFRQALARCCKIRRIVNTEDFELRVANTAALTTPTRLRNLQTLQDISNRDLQQLHFEEEVLDTKL